MKAAALGGLKALAVWLALMAGALIGGALVEIPVTASQPDGPLSARMAFPVVNGLGAILLSALAAYIGRGSLEKAVILFVTLFAAETLLSSIEAYYFADHLKISADVLAGGAAANLFKAALGALVASSLWRTSTSPREHVGGSFPKLAVLVPFYVILYFTGGYLIAWQSDAVRAFYGDGIEIDNVELVLLQFGRGLAWASLALLLFDRLRGSRTMKAVMVGAAFAVFAGAPLLYPNSFMPWAVRQIHLVEISVSNMLFGAIAILLFDLGQPARRAAPNPPPRAPH